MITSTINLDPAVIHKCRQGFWRNSQCCDPMVMRLIFGEIVKEFVFDLYAGCFLEQKVSYQVRDKRLPRATQSLLLAGQCTSNLQQESTWEDVGVGRELRKEVNHLCTSK